MRSLFLYFAVLLTSFGHEAHGACANGNIEWTNTDGLQCPTGNNIQQYICAGKSENWQGKCKCADGCKQKDANITGTAPCTWMKNQFPPKTFLGTCLFGRPSTPSTCTCVEAAPPPSGPGTPGGPKLPGVPVMPPTKPGGTTPNPTQITCSSIPGGLVVTEDKCDPEMYGRCKCVQKCGPGCPIREREIFCSCQITASGANKPQCGTTFNPDAVCGRW